MFKVEMVPITDMKTLSFVVIFSGCIGAASKTMAYLYLSLLIIVLLWSFSAFSILRSHYICSANDSLRSATKAVFKLPSEARDRSADLCAKPDACGLSIALRFLGIPSRHTSVQSTFDGTRDHTHSLPMRRLCI